MTFARSLTEASERRQREKEAHLASLCVPSKSRGSYEGRTSGQAVEKPEPYRDDSLLQMAKDRPCLLMVPAVCNHRQDTTVAAHSNLGQHGKAKSRKADDQYSVWACFSCHLWLDMGKASAEDKLSAFMAAHARQVLAWRLVAMDPNEPERFRKAARRALERLDATVLGEEV